MKAKDLLYAYLELALARGASDLTVCPGEPLVLRVQRRLERGELVPRADFEDLLGDLVNHDVGSLAHAGERFRYIHYRAEGGPVLEIRHVAQRLRSLEDLGAPPAFREMLSCDHGLLIVTGKTGEGKSTTLAAAVDHLNETREDRKIVTLEHPIEYRHTSKKALVRQRELGEHFAAFPEAIEAAMRQDPDVIMVGEMRGPASMAAALTAAETGQLVLGTLHTKDAAGSVSRILDGLQGLDIAEQLAGSLLGVLAQQLVRTTEGTLAAAYEFLANSTAVASCIRERRIDHLRDEIRRGQSRGMIAMDAALESLVRSGRVPKAEAIRRASSPAALELKLAYLC